MGGRQLTANGFYGIRLQCELEAIDEQTVTRMPDMPAWMNGCIVHGNEVIPIIDLSAFLPEGPRAADKQQIIVVGMAEEKTRFGLLVDHLGGMEEIPLSRLDDVPANMGEGTALIESLVKPEGGTGGRLLMILSIRHLMERLARMDDQKQNQAAPMKLVPAAAAQMI